MCATVTMPCTWCGRGSGSWPSLVWNTCPQKVWRTSGNTLVEIITTPIYNSPSRKPSFVESIRINIRGPRFYAWLWPEGTRLSKKCPPVSLGTDANADGVIILHRWQPEDVESLTASSKLLCSGEQCQSRNQGERVWLRTSAYLGLTLARVTCCVFCALIPHIAINCEKSLKWRFWVFP